MIAFHLHPLDDGLILIREGSSQPAEEYPYDTQEKATAYAGEFISKINEPASLRVHRADGTIEDERTYPPA